MRWTAVLLAGVITVTIGTAALGAMTADFQSVASRGLARESKHQRLLDPVWYGGVLAPVVVEATRDGHTAGRAPAPVRSLRTPSTRIASARVS
jgi:hypothetical protein